MERTEFGFRLWVFVLCGLGVGAPLAAGCSSDDAQDAAPLEPTSRSKQALDPVCDPAAAFGSISRVLPANVTAEGFAPGPDGRTAIITHRSGGNYDLFLATRPETTGTFDWFTRLPGDANSLADERAPWLSANGFRLFFHRQGTVGSTDLYFSERTGLEQPFGTPWLVPGVNAASVDEDAFLVPSEQRLYFTSHRDTSVDLHVADLVNGSFSQISSLTGLNTEEPEGRPVISSDERKIYFKSRRSGVYSDMDGDIFLAQRTSTGVPFANPTNVSLLNTGGIDFPVWLSADGCDLYFASNREAISKTTDGGLEVFHLYRGRRHVVPSQVTITVNVLGSGTVGAPFNCSASGGTCTLTRTFGQSLVVFASTQGYWTGVCEPNGNRLSSDGILPFTLDGTCTVNFTSGGICAGAPIDDGNPCTVDSCHPVQGVVHAPAPAGTSCADIDVCNGAETCNASGVCTAGTPTGCGPGGPCQDNAHCAVGLTCVSGTCTCAPGSTNPQCFPSHCSNGVTDGNETDEDCGGACAGCGPEEICTSDPDCADGLACVNGSCSCVPDCEGRCDGPDGCGGTCRGGPGATCCSDGNSCQDELACVNGTCMPQDCFLNPVATGCGFEGAPCGPTCTLHPTCTQQSDCPSGFICPEGNGWRYAVPGLRVCERPEWECDSTHPPGGCGGPLSNCGVCDCVPECADKDCGDTDLDDGCGGRCTAVCDSDDIGCELDADCQSGSVCRASRCRPADPCGSPTKVFGHCGGVESLCGPCPNLDTVLSGQPTCGTDPATGASFGSCPGGMFCNAAGHCAALETTPNIFVPNADGSLREVIPEPIPAAENGIGTVAGHFGVTDRGSASYAIPIVVPPGRSIMPSLALRYTSSAGNGALGAGFSLDGLSNITRCAKIYALDGYNHPPIGENSDAFCLDGQRLVRLENGDYRTAVDTFARIRPVFPVGELRPDSFTLHAKDGRILTYGGLGAQGRVGQRGISTWALSRVEDRSGNFMRITYRAGLENVDGIAEMVPHVITYTGHGDIDGDREVEFVYDQTRPDQYFRENIVPASRSFRLNSILVRAQQRFVRQYNLSYDPALDTSQLTSIEECVAPGICKLPTTFDYVPEEPRFASREGGGLHDCAFNGCINPPKISPLGFAHWRQNDGFVAQTPGWGGRDWMATTSNDTYITRVSPTLAGPSFVVSFVPVVGAFASMALNILAAIGDRAETTTYRYDIDVVNGLAQRTGTANRKRYSTRHVVASDPTNGDNEQVLYYDQQIVRTGRQVTMECTDVQYEMCTYEIFAVTSPRLWYVDVDGNGVQDKLFCEGEKLYLTLSRAGETGIAEVPVDGSVQTSDADVDAPDLCRVECAEEQIYNRLYGEGVVGVGCADDRPFSVTLDVDGDGTSNLVFYSRLHGWFYVNYDGDLHLKNEVFSGVTLSATHKNYVAALDANGDGLRDILGLPDKASAPNTKAVILYNSGAGFTQQNLDAEGDLGFAPSLVPFVIDYDRDGTEELIEPTALYQDESELPHAWRVRRISDGRISEETVDSLVGGPGTLADFDGDGDLDAYTQAASRDPEFENHAYLHRGQGRHKGLLKSVTDGLGHRVDIAYDEPGHPDPDRPSDFAIGLNNEICKWPVRCPTRVNHALVTSHVESHSTGGQSVTERMAKYHYGRWLTDMGGYGALGFLNRYVVETDASGTELGRTWYEYVQPTPGPRTPPYGHPTAGLVKQVIVQGPFLSSRIGAGYTPRTVTRRDWITQTSADGRPFPVLQQETTLSGVLGAYIQDPSGLPVRVEGTSAHSSRTVVNTVDSYGNITDQNATEFDLEGQFPDQTSIAGSESSMTVHRRFEPTQAEVDAWFIGLVKSEDVTSSPRCHRVLDCASLTKTRHSTSEYDSETGLLRLTHRQPGDPTLDQQSLFERDAFGNVVSMTKSDTSGNTRIVATAFDTRGMFPITVTAVGSGISHTTQVRFDDRFGNLTARADPNGIDETRSYDELGIERHQRGPDGERTLNYGSVPPFTSDLGLPIDAVIRFVSNETGGEEQTEDLNAFGQSVRRSTTGLHGVLVSTESIYDERQRLVQQTRLHREGNGSQGYLAFEYDLLDRVITQTNADGSQILRDNAPFTAVQGVFLFNDPGAGAVQVTRIVDANTNATVTVTNRAGQPVWVFDAAFAPGGGGVTFYDYDGFDLVRRIHAAYGEGESHFIDLNHDAFGRLTEVIDPQHGGSERTIYNGLDEVVESRDAAERLTRNFYDSLGRLEHIEDEDGITQFTYDGDGSQANTIGRLVETISPTGQRVTHGYEPRENGFNRGFANRVTRQLNAAGNGPGSGGVRTLETRFTYDGNSRLERLEYPEGAAGSRLALEYGYDSFGHNIRVSDALNPSTVHWELLETDPDQGMRIHKERLGSAQCESTLGTTTTRSYHPLRGTLSSIGTDCGNMEIQRLTYDHDPGRNLAVRSDDIANTSESFDYDPEDRLTHVNGAETYRYRPAVGQLDWQAGLGTYTYDTSTLVSTAGDNQYAPHDAVGNITQRSGAFVPFGSQTIEYTTFDLPRTVVNGSDDTTNFSYDAAGVRAVKQTTEYAQFYAGDLFQRRETATDTLHRAIIYAGGRAVAQVTQRETNNSITTETRYLHDDHLGSIQAITTETGSLESQRRYSPFGRKQVSGSSDVPYGFTGHEEDDDLGLVNMKGRMYDPYLGQFLTADPIIQSPYGTGLNRFAYVRNSPTNYVDPSGFQLAEVAIGSEHWRTTTGADGVQTHYFRFSEPHVNWTRSGATAPVSAESFGGGPAEVIGAGGTLLTATNSVLQMYQRSSEHISTAVTQTDVRGTPSSDSAIRPSGATSSTPIAPDGVDGARTAATHSPDTWPPAVNKPVPPGNLLTIGGNFTIALPSPTPFIPYNPIVGVGLGVGVDVDTGEYYIYYSREYGVGTPQVGGGVEVGLYRNVDALKAGDDLSVDIGGKVEWTGTFAGGKHVVDGEFVGESLTVGAGVPGLSVGVTKGPTQVWRIAFPSAWNGPFP